MQAVQSHNSSLLQLLLTVPGSVSSDDASSSLIAAVAAGDELIVDILLTAGVPLNSISDNATMPLLSRAVIGGHGAIVERLIAAGCAVNCKYNGSTALHCCITHGQDACLSALVAAGANINAVDSTGNTPLILAAKNARRCASSMKKLVDAGCDLEMADNERRTALHYACYRAVGVEMLLSAGANPDKQVTS